MKKLLFISYFAPYDRVDHAGGKVHNFYVKKLQKEKEYDLTLLTMCYQRECERLDLEEYGIKHRLVVLDKSPVQKYVRMFFSGFSYFNPFDKYGKVLLNYERYRIKKMIARYAAEGERPELIILQWTQILLLMPFVKKLYPDAKIVAIEEDVLFLNFYRRIGLAKNLWQKYIATYQYYNLRKRELAALHGAQQIVVNNFKDAALLVENGIDGKDIFTSSVYFENYGFVKRTGAGCCEEGGTYRDILFYGAMHRDENHISAMWFIEHVLPLLPERFRLVVVGARPRKELLSLAGDRVRVMGFVEDITGYFASCFCLAASLRLGAGIKVKVLEAMSAGVPVLTNDIGIEGIGCRNGREYWHCQRAEEYADRILWMEGHTCEAAKIAENGRKYIEENFDLEKKYGELVRVWDKM